MPESSAKQEPTPKAHNRSRAVADSASAVADELPAVGFMPVAGALTLGDHGSTGLRRRGGAVDDPLGGSPVDGAVVDALRRRRGSGSPLPPTVSGPMGAELGIDTSTVRVHADAEAGSMARSVQAAAFTHGNDIYFAPGAYQPASDAGRRTIAHELSHVAAQRSGADGGRSGPLAVGRANDPAEAAADRSADRVLTALRRTASPVAGEPTVGVEVTSAIPSQRALTSERTLAAIRRAPGKNDGTGGTNDESGGGVGTLTRDDDSEGPESESTESGGAPVEESEEDRKKRVKREKNKRRKQERRRKKEVKEYRREQFRAQNPELRQHAAQARKGRALLESAGQSATKEAQRLKPGPQDKGAAEEVVWARSLAGGDPAKNQRLLKIRHAIDGPEMVTWLETNAGDDAKLTYLAGNLGKFASPFDEARFDLFIARQGYEPIFEKLLGLAPVAWSVADITNVLGATAERLGAAEQSSLLERCRVEGWRAAQVLDLTAGLPKEILAHLSATATLGKELSEQGKTWTFADMGTVIKEFHAKVNDLLNIEKFIKAGRTCEMTAAESRKLMEKCRKEILLGFADPAKDLHQQVKEAKTKAAWTDFAKIGDLFEAYYTKQADCAMMAKLVKGSAKYKWTQDNVKLLVDGVKAPPLKDISETEDFQTKIENVSKKWPNWTQLAEVVDTGYDKAMDKDDVVGLLKECTDYHVAGKYEATQAKAYITTASQAGGYTWAERLAQAQKFRGHVQPAGGTNDLGGAINVLGHYDVPPAQGGPYRARVVLPENKHTHFKDGHSYEAFWFDVGNCHRYGGLSSMWAPGTNIAAKAATAAGGGLTNQIKNAAWNAGGTQQVAGNYVIAYAYLDQTGPQTYRVAVSQFYPQGAWLHHQLEGYLAEGIGRLRGYIT